MADAKGAMVREVWGAVAGEFTRMLAKALWLMQLASCELGSFVRRWLQGGCLQVMTLEIGVCDQQPRNWRLNWV